MRSIKFAPTLALIATLALSAMVSAGIQRPMKGSYSLAVVPFDAVEQRCGPNALTIGVEGVGIVTHMGRITGWGSNCTEFSLFTEAVPLYDGLATFVAADGSTLNTSYDGMQQEPVNGVAASQTNFTVLSGTGRFEGASGSFTSSDVIDFAAGTVTGTLSGWISY